MASLPRSSPSLSGTPSRPRADDATLGCETRSGISPRRDGADHSRSTASPAYNTRPVTPEAGSPAPTYPSRQPSWVSSQVDDATRSYGTRNKISPDIDESDRSHSTTSASSTRSGTPKAGSPTPTSPPDTSSGSGATTSPDAFRSRSPRKRRRNPRRTSQHPLRDIGASVNSDPDASNDSDSDDASVSARPQPETYDDEEFHPPYLSECGHWGSGGGDATDETDEELGSPSPKRRKTCRSPSSPSRPRRSRVTSLHPDTSVAPARTSHSALKIPSPPPSHDSPQERPGKSASAKFEEWLLPDATLARVMLGDGRVTFKLQFSWDPQVDGRHADCPSSNRSQVPISRDSSRRKLATGSRLAFTSDEDKVLRELKEGGDDLTWPVIYERFDDAFPGRRSQGSLQVHYSTKLKRRGAC